MIEPIGIRGTEMADVQKTLGTQTSGVPRAV
jgi:hypothetical protein